MLASRLKSGAAPLYADDVFSAYTYTGTATTNNIVNGLNLASNGGMVWIKRRNAANGNAIFDTARGINQYYYTSATDASATQAGSLTAFNSNGFTLSDADAVWNHNTGDYVSWTFRKSPLQKARRQIH